MKIPDKLLLNCEEYEVLKVTQKQMNELNGEKDTEGMIIPKKRVIILVDAEDIEETLWHELGHYFLKTFGYKDNEQGAEAFSQLVRSVNEQLSGKKFKRTKLVTKDTK